MLSEEIAGVNEKETASHVEAKGQSVRDAPSLFKTIVASEWHENNRHQSLLLEHFELII